MFGQIGDEDRRVTPYKIHKRFRIDYYNGVDTATRLGVIPLHAVSGSLNGNPGFTSASADKITFTSGGADYHYFKRPLYTQLKLNFFEFALPGNRHSATVPQPQHQLDNNFLPFGHGKAFDSTRQHWEVLGLRKLHNQVNVISVPQKIFGEQIKTGSVELTDYSTENVFVIKDDGHGNLYDTTYETQFTSAALTAKGSGSSIGTVSYNHGLIMITDTGSYGTVAGQSSGSGGWKLEFDATKTIYEHEYTCLVPEGTFNNSTNISVSLGRSGSMDIPGGLDNNNLRQLLSSPAEGQYDNTNGYAATVYTENFATHSMFAPYVTTIGLYNDHGDLLAVAKTTRPVRNDPELALNFIIRFDI
jgi:hypothetical protein